MNPGLFLLAAVAGGLGAMLRYLADLGVARLAGRRFPWGIMLVNISGSFALGLITTALPDAAFLLGAGLLGGYTTFSTAMLDTVALWRDDERRGAAFNAVGMLLLGLVAAAVGLLVGSVI
ncbi:MULTISPECIES: CrcB family protein [unclassified Microbacterium]|uniref:fluoride efflux transporter FluC n=1 Tax=unclassified Microbacterium TaxID=2609290 RepID=UPI000EA87293|nr:MULTISPECIES: CrcB family protein [unclassified Microbacterium]MBT2484488.1 CrcB family protein [Microbacterium sp. ISL-108]RKN67394.1 CrcB family protein [Microbacterium sp. CGR2]